MGAGRDRRKQTRVPLRFPLRYRLVPGGAAGRRAASVEDLSLEGVRFRSPEMVAVRQRLLLDLLFPGDQAVQAVAVAAWVRELPGHDGFEVGGRFVDRPSAALRTIARQVDARIPDAEPQSA